MLDFITAHRDLIERRTRELLALPVSKPTLKDIDNGIPILIDQLVDTLRRGVGTSESEMDIEKVATQYGGLLYARGFTVGDLVRGYGTICEAITKLGQQLNVSFSTRDFEMLNRVLDVAIAAAVTEYQRRRAEAAEHEELQHIGSLARELRIALTTAVMTCSVIKNGVVGTGGRTSVALDRSLKRMGDLLDRALAEVRLRTDAVPIMEPLRVAEVLDEIAAMVSADTEARRQSLEIDVNHDLEITTDRQYFTSAVSNLVQNGVKYTPTGGHIRVRARSLDGHFVIEVEDECGGFLTGSGDDLFAPYVRGTTQGPGTGVGLSIVARATRALGGDVHVRNLPGQGCLFRIELPPVPVARTAA